VKKYGTGSMQFDGTGDYLQFPPSDKFAFGTGDWTIECWINDNGTSNGGVFGLTDESDYLDENGQLAFQIFAGDVYFSTATGLSQRSVAVPSGWFHCAMARQNNVVKCFVNGTQVGADIADSTDYSAYKYLGIGRFFDATISFNGYIDDFRITKGVARYTANFTPPAAKLPNL